MKIQTDDDFLAIILLVTLSILILFRTGLYIIFDNHFLNIDGHLKIRNEKEVDYVLTLFSIIRLFLATTILHLRKFRNDLLSYGLLYLIFTSFVRFYYQYLRTFNRKNPVIKWIDRYQDINALILFFISTYILAKIFYY